jgi:hypothetical protein
VRAAAEHDPFHAANRALRGVPHPRGPAFDERAQAIRRFGELLRRGLRQHGPEQPGEGIRHAYSHSMVAGGFELTSYTTRLTPSTSLLIRSAARASTSCGNGYQSAVIPSLLVTARRATTWS